MKELRSDISSTMGKADDNKLKRAKKKIEEIKGFYIHLCIYIIVNLFVTVKNVVGSFHDGKSFWDAFWDFGNYAVWIFWGIGLVFHGIYTFNYNPSFIKKWEERQIRKYMEEDKREFEKYR